MCPITREEAWRLRAIAGIMQPNKRNIDLALEILNLPVDFSPLENGCVMKTDATYPMYILSGRVISGEC